ncbi:hypothetical protein EWE75_18655 [Sphingomonas populi]|uniref:Uncharacterized protein n=1 Tax=Sphingomonas populi TaxID=2484750 RepID=A0A4Q6XMD0_9SPHN|nr:hypothetical protein EWE75_18655 [Sphingomonas populi]
MMQEYRYTIVEDASIKALYPAAIEIEVDTNLDASGGAALASSLWGQTNSIARQFDVEIEDVLYLDDFLTSPNRYVVSFDKHPAAGVGKTYTLIGAKIDYSANRTTLTVRG